VCSSDLVSCEISRAFDSAARARSPISTLANRQTSSKRFSVKLSCENMRLTLASLMPIARATCA